MTPRSPRPPSRPSLPSPSPSPSPSPPPATACAILNRHRSGPQGTFGTLMLPGLRLVTGELPWHGNEYGLSCIPPGLYTGRPADSENRGRHLHLVFVPQRQEILIHAGHWCGDEAQGLRSDVRGCILVGTEVFRLAGQDAVKDARAALDRLLDLVPQGLDLLVQDGTPEGNAGDRWRP